MKKMMKLLFAVGVVGTISISHAANWPIKPITIIVPAAPGGTTDIATRLLAESLQDELGQPVIVENKAGAAGIIGSQQLVRAKPDGYTLIMGNIGPNSINYSLYNQLPYKASDFAPISLVISVPNVLVVHEQATPQTAQELIAELKQNPGQFAFGTSGAGQSPHLSAELFMLKTGTQAIHTPYKGAGPAVAGLLGQQFLFMIDNLPSSLPSIQAGKFKALAVTSAERIQTLPDVPTMKEVGVDDMVVNAWFGLMAPAGTPKEIIDTLSQATSKALNSDSIQTRFAAMGGIQTDEGNSPEKFAALIDKEIARWHDTIESAQIEKR